MDTKMEAELIRNEERQDVEEATETPQPVQQTPPSYTSPTVGYPNGPTQQQGMYATQPQQPTYIIQNIPAQQSPGCCGGKSDWFKESAGMTTGIVQLIIAIIASILSGVGVWYQIHKTSVDVGPMGTPIGATIFIFLPAGILGACSKNKSNCVIVAYLVMSILAAIQAGFVCAVESTQAAFSYHQACPDIPDYRDYPPFDDMGREYPEIAVDYACSWERFKCLTAIHAVIAVLMFAEFIVAIVASAICCGGLNCCCPRQQTQQTRPNAMMYYPQASVQPFQAQTGTHVVQGSELPIKA